MDETAETYVNDSIWSGEFWKATAERALKTLAQSAGSVAIAAGTGLIDTDWIPILSVGGMAAVISILTSVGSGFISNGHSPSLSTEVVVARRAKHNQEDLG